MVDDPISILRAGEQHVEQIARIAESWSLHQSGRGNAAFSSENGFLVSAYSEADYRARLENAEHFYVAVKDGQVCAFLLAYSSSRVESGEWLNNRIKTALGNFLVIKQVCVSRDLARRGIASMLYHHVLGQWLESPVIAAVVNDPPNKASAGFHRKLGFQELTRLTPPDGLPRLVWVWRKPREALLHAQYAISVELYRHEDVTNWQKLNNFFYVTAGLAAAVAFSLDGKGVSGDRGRNIAIIVSIAGFGISLAFSQMLRFGRRYLLARKAAVAELEEYMAWYGGQRIVTWQATEPGNSYLQASPTGVIMICLPLLMGICWLGMICVLLIS